MNTFIYETIQTNNTFDCTNFGRPKYSEMSQIDKNRIAAEIQRIEKKNEK